MSELLDDLKDRDILHLATKGNVEHVGMDVVLALLDALAAKNKEGNTILHYAALYYGSRGKPIYAIMRRLQKKTHIKEEDYPEVDRNRCKKLLEVVQPLLNKYANVKNEIGQTPLHYASYGDGRKMVEMLLKAGSEKMLQDKQGDTPLHLAAYAGSIEAVKALLESGATPGVRNKRGETPLHFAVLAKEAVKALLESGANLGDKTEYGQTPLHYAVQSMKVDVIEVLINSKAVHDRDNRGRTPLYVAARGGNAIVIDLLLRHGANLAVKDAQGATRKEIIEGNQWLSLYKEPTTAGHRSKWRCKELV
jgi:hypothetical protein